MVFEADFFSGNSINPKHESKGNKHGGRRCPSLGAVIQGEVEFWVLA